MLNLLGPRPPIDPFQATLALVDALIVFSVARLIIWMVGVPFVEAIYEWIHPIGRFHF